MDTMATQMPLPHELRSDVLTPERKAVLQKAIDLASALGNYCVEHNIGAVMLVIGSGNDEHGYVHWSGDKKR